MSSSSPLILAVTLSPNPVQTRASLKISVQVEECTYERLEKFTHAQLKKYTHSNLSKDELK